MRIHLVLVLLLSIVTATTTASAKTTAKKKLPAASSHFAHFSTVVVNLKDPRFNSDWLLNDTKFKGPKDLTDMADMRRAEFNRRFQECSSLGLKAFANHSEFRGWIAQQGIECSLQDHDVDLGKQWLVLLEKHSEVLWHGPTRFTLWQQVLRLQVSLLKLATRSIHIETVDRLIESHGQLSASERAELYRLVGDMAYLEDQKDAAKHYYLQSVNYSYNKELADKLANWKIILGTKNGNGVVAVNTPEEELSQKQTEFSNASNWIQGIEVGIKSLQLYPGGMRSQGIAERVIADYQRLSDAAVVDVGNLDSAMNLLKKAPSSRTAEWARILHKKGDYMGALTLADSALVDSENSPQLGGTLLYIAGRCSHFLGKYREALAYFVKLNEKHSSYVELAEVRFRMGLLHLRLKEYDLAIQDFVSVSTAPENKNYDLGAQYWMIRALQKQNRDYQEYYTYLQRVYGVSYYGLRLQAEKNDLVVQWNLKEELPAYKLSIGLTKEEKRAYNRAVRLAKAGWFQAAVGEIAGWTYWANSEDKIVAAVIYANFFQYQMSIRLLTDASKDMDIKNPNLIRIGFPTPFRSLIDSEAKKNGLDSGLVLGLMRQESAFTLKAQSGSAAQGLMQMIPPTALEVAHDLKIKKFQAGDIFLPNVNIKFGTYYLAKVIRQMGGNVALGLASYNAGPHRVKKFLDLREELHDGSKLSQLADPWSDLWIEELPWVETNLYVKSILRNQWIYELLSSGKLDLKVMYESNNKAADPKN